MSNSPWTPSRKKAFITTLLRSGFSRWPPKYITLKAAFLDKQINPKTGRIASFYKCAICDASFIAKDVQVDHINPVVGYQGFTSWDDFIDRLFCESDNLRVLCKPCHKTITLSENSERRQYKKEKQ